MSVNVPKTLPKLLFTCYRHIFPEVRTNLNRWENFAERVPNDELNKQAKASIDTKTFHCEGGAIYATLAKSRWKEAVKFIVAYQTISDYLDNLCDRSTSMDPDDFRRLHDSMLNAILNEPVNEHPNYYELREDQDDGGYLASLVDTCQEVVQKSRIMSVFTQLSDDSHSCISIFKFINTSSSMNACRGSQVGTMKRMSTNLFCGMSFLL